MLDRVNMLTIDIVCVGRLKEKYLVMGIAEYAKRLSSYCKLTIHEVPDEKAPETMSDAEEKIVLKKEGDKILSFVKPNAHVIALTLDGEMWSSEKLADTVNSLTVYGKSNITFIIGGSNGLSSDVIRRADNKLCFGKMTLPHQLMRLVLVEQIYRAMKINRGEPYHK